MQSHPECFPTDASKVVCTWTRSSTGNWWSLMNSSMILNPASLITTARTVPRWPCRTSARLELCQPTRMTLTSTPTPLHPPRRGDEQRRPAPSQYQGPHPHCNVMDLSTFQKAPSKQLSDAKQARWFQRKLCFHCGQAGPISRGRLNGVWNPQDHLQPSSSAWLSKLHAESGNHERLAPAFQCANVTLHITEFHTTILHNNQP
ncbi:uncharacterized protein VP01_2623g2 [Puccinia sorghi]|uniref:Uncharacterized protein n=1 Tax=Puccinia sorghi TaxID=27349 RepID=A0A0L6V688_9BASI|nr:uncharacterized protein VP01_2623g2 [Puccinia sorghi]